MIRGLKSKLSDAMAGGELVRIECELQTGTADGYVVALGRQRVVLLIVGDGITFAGFQAFRLKDLSALSVPAPYAAFVEKVLRKRNLHRPMPLRLDLSSAATILLSANARYPLVTVHCEVSDPEVCHVGWVVTTSRTSVTLHEVGPDAAWGDAPLKYPLADMTRIDFGGPYEDALWLIGGSANE